MEECGDSFLRLVVRDKKWIELREKYGGFREK